MVFEQSSKWTSEWPSTYFSTVLNPRATVHDGIVEPNFRKYSEAHGGSRNEKENNDEASIYAQLRSVKYG